MAYFGRWREPWIKRKNIGQGRGDRNNEARCCRCGQTGWGDGEGTTGFWQHCRTVRHIREPLSSFSPGDLVPGAAISCSTLHLSSWDSPCFSLMRTICFLDSRPWPVLFTPHLGNHLFPLSEQVSGSWTFSAVQMTESLRREFRGRTHSGLEGYGHDIIVFQLLWLPRSLLLFWLCCSLPFWKPRGFLFIPGFLRCFSSHCVFIHLLSP